MNEEQTWFEPGKTYQFYGVDYHHFKLDDRVLEAKEDESDGYRSYLDSVVVLDTTDLIFAREPLDTVTVVEVDEIARGVTYQDYPTAFDGYILTGADGHEWLYIGTDNYDDYYPCFVFAYTPKAAALEPTP